MKKEVADIWVAALRSGKYKQGKSVLRAEDSFCCLGVLCEISGKKYHPIRAIIPEAVRKWSGMKTCVGILDDASYSDEGIIHDESCLTAMNDCGKYTFNDIADVIEKNWEKL